MPRISKCTTGGKVFEAADRAPDYSGLIDHLIVSVKRSTFFLACEDLVNLVTTSDCISIVHNLFKRVDLLCRSDRSGALWTSRFSWLARNYRTTVGNKFVRA